MYNGETQPEKAMFYVVCCSDGIHSFILHKCSQLAFKKKEKEREKERKREKERERESEASTRSDEGNEHQG